MQELEKILEEMDDCIREAKEKFKGHEDNGALRVYVSVMKLAKTIAIKHMYAKDNNASTDDGWIPVEKELPPFGQRLQATILHHEWIADYNSSWVPDEEKSYHPEYTEVCEIYPIEGMWFYACGEDGYEKDVAYINPKKDLGNPISEIIAWRPMPEPYRPERRRKA